MKRNDRSFVSATVLVVLALALTCGAASAKAEPANGNGLRHFEFARYAPSGMKVWDSWVDVHGGCATIKKDGYLVYIDMSDKQFYAGVPEESSYGTLGEIEGRRFYYANFPGVGQVFAREKQPGETWVFKAGGLTKVDTVGHIPGRRYRYDWTSHVGDKNVADGMSESAAGWFSSGIGKKGSTMPWKVLVFKTPEAALAEGKPTDLIPEDRTWAHVVIPGAGDVYATVDEPGQTWTVTCFGVTVTAGAGPDKP